MSLLKTLKPDRSVWKAGVRTAAAAGISFLLAQLLALPQGYWSVLTAIVVMQASVGASIKAASDRLIGTFVGAAIGFVIASLTPSTDMGTLGGLLFSTGFLAMLAARYASFRIAPMTSAILLISAPSHVEAWISALHRVIEIGLGCTIGIIVAMVVAPSRAVGSFRAQAGRILPMLADLLADELKDLGKAANEAARAKAADDLAVAFDKLDSLTEDVKRERISWMRHDGSDAGRLRHGLINLRTAVMFVGSVTRLQRLERVGDRLTLALDALSDAVRQYLLALSPTIARTTPPPSTDALKEAFSNFEATAIGIREAANERHVAGYIATLAFALDQVLSSIEQLAESTRDIEQAANS